jgi:predicted outer membrane repeat protein
MILRSSKRSRSHTRPSHRPGFRPTLEALEVRIVPDANIPVTNTNDTGDGSLRAAIAQANNSTGQIVIDMRSVSGAITLESALDPLARNITITGPGYGNLLIQRDWNQGSFPIFRIFGQSLSCAIQDLTLGRGSSNNGGAIYNSGTLSVLGCVFGNNTATSGGGAIYNNGTLNASNCSFNDNTAGSYGGAIANSVEGVVGRLILTNGCQFGMNSAGSQGGAIFNSQGANAIIRDNASFAENSAQQGGGIFNRGTLQMIGGGFLFNWAQDSGGFQAGRGGGYYGDYFSSASFQGVAFDGNSADDKGGGFYLASGTLGLDTCTIGVNFANTAVNAGPGGYVVNGATYTPVNCTINDQVVTGA